MASKQSATTLRKALHKAENNEARDRLEKALLKAQEIAVCNEVPNFTQIALESQVSHSTLGHHFNGHASKREDGLKCCILPPMVEKALVDFLLEAAC